MSENFREEVDFPQLTIKTPKHLLHLNLSLCNYNFAISRFLTAPESIPVFIIF